MKITVDADHVIFDYTLPGPRCQHCGAYHTLVLPMLSQRVVAVLRAFCQRHAECVEVAQMVPEMEQVSA